MRESSLPDVPFHAYDLQRRRGGYAGLDLVGKTDYKYRTPESAFVAR